MSFILCTDRCADLPIAVYAELRVPVIPLMCSMNGNDLPDGIMDSHTFYDKLRSGVNVMTSLINIDRYMLFFEAFLKSGKDILYLSFSSGLSGTCQSAHNAAGILQEKYPDRVIRIVDTLSASMGQGLLVFEAARRRDSGMAIEQLANWVEENRLHCAHWFTVDDLFYLKRGGRISGAEALIGSILAVKPIMHMSDEGKLVPVGREKGRKKSLRALVEKMKETMDRKWKTVMISHCDAPQDAEYLADLVRGIFPEARILIHPVGTVIGSHAGPGTVSVFFSAIHR